MDQPNQTATTDDPFVEDLRRKQDLRRRLAELDGLTVKSVVPSSTGGTLIVRFNAPGIGKGRVLSCRIPSHSVRFRGEPRSNFLKEAILDNLVPLRHKSAPDAGSYGATGMVKAREARAAMAVETGLSVVLEDAEKALRSCLAGAAAVADNKHAIKMATNSIRKEMTKMLAAGMDHDAILETLKSVLEAETVASVHRS